MFFPIGDEESRPGSTATVVLAFIAFNVLVFVAELQGGLDRTTLRYGGVPYLLTHDLDGSWYTAFTSMFMHGSWMHLFGNMLFMWIFADNIEDLLGESGFLIFYVACGLCALAAHVALDPNSKIPVVGASGAISGVLGAYIAMFPHNSIRNFYWVYFFVGVTNLPAWLYLGIWFLMQLLMARVDATGGGVAFGAHVGGFVAGVVLIQVFPKRAEALHHYRWRTGR